MKKVFQQMYLESANASRPAEEDTWHGIPQLIVSILNVNKWGVIKCVANFPGSKKFPGAQIVSSKQVLSSMGWGVQRGWGRGGGGGLVSGLTGNPPTP